MQVEQYHNKNQFLIRNGKDTYFQSYESMVAHYNDDTKKLTLGKDWNYSNTTRKHLYLFIDYYTSIYLNNKKNKSSYIQSLIDDGVINYDESL